MTVEGIILYLLYGYFNLYKESENHHGQLFTGWKAEQLSHQSASSHTEGFQHVHSPEVKTEMDVYQLGILQIYGSNK